VNVAVLVKQVPATDALVLDDHGRLRRAGLPAEMNPFCRRAVAKGVELAHVTGGCCTAITMGPPTAEDTVREAVAFGADRGVVLSDPALAGSDTLATARALAAVLRRCGPFDLVLLGRSSVDAETGQLGAQVAELLDLPFVAAARAVERHGRVLRIVGERDDGWRQVDVELPAVVSAAERLIDPCKMSPEARRAVPADRIERLTVDHLGPGQWGAAGSPTTVGAVRSVSVDRTRRKLVGAPADQVRAAVAELAARNAISGPGGRQPPAQRPPAAPVPPPASSLDGPEIAVVAEPGQGRTLRPLVGEAAVVARAVGGHVTVVGPGIGDRAPLGAWGADCVTTLTGALVEEDVAAALESRWTARPPWAVLVPATVWGREVAGRLAAALGAGLVGDAVGVGVTDGRLVGVKPVLGGQLLAEVSTVGEPQLVTVRPGVLPLRAPRPSGPRPVRSRLVGAARGRVTVVAAAQDDEVGLLASAPVVVCAGLGVGQEDLPQLESLAATLGGVLGATRKVTDRGWLPRSRQIGITGQSVAPRLLVLVGVSGALNHMIATQAAGTVLAVNVDPDAKVFDWADVGMVADWRQVVPLLTEALAAGPPAAACPAPNPLAAPGDSSAPASSSASISDLGTPSR